HLGLRRFADDVPRAADDHRPPVFFHHCNQGYTVEEIDIHQRRDFVVAEAAFEYEEPPIEGSATGAGHGICKGGLVIRLDRANPDTAPVAQRLKRGIGGRLHRRTPSPPASALHASISSPRSSPLSEVYCSYDVDRS